MSLQLSGLKKLHDKGLALIWLKPKSKRPVESGWTSGPRHEWEILENSFEKTRNVGVRLGEPSRLPSGNYLCAIDCDVKSKSRKAITEMNEALKALGLDVTSAPIVMSGRGNGSKHIYVQVKEPTHGFKLVSSNIKVKVSMPGETRPHSKAEMSGLTDEERSAGLRIRPAWEIAFMGTGQQTVLPPSVHPDTGVKYAWGSPMTVKHCPTFKPPKAAVGGMGLKKEAKGLPEPFVACDVDLWASKLTPRVIGLIVDGKGCADRSASLMMVAMSMCRAGFTDNEILTVLSDPNNYLAGAAYDRRRGRASAVEWLWSHTLKKARYETSVMRYFDNPPDGKARQPVSEEEARATVEKINEEMPPGFDLTKAGTPKPTLKNIVCALEQKMGGGLVSLNEFSNRTFFAKDTPYGGEKGKELMDHHETNLKHHLACHYAFEPAVSICFEAHTVVSRKYKFHPVRDYLKGLEWDGVARLDEWLKKAFGVNSGNPRYIKAVSRKVLVGAVARVFEPGVKFDQVLVLEGEQGVGKSMGLSMLASPAWFTDSLGDIHNKDVVDQMTGKWIVELSELAGIKGREAEQVKSFLSRQVDRVRMSYGRRSEDYPRQSIFVGSTNAFEYFEDETGNRRFWPVRVGQADLEWLENNRGQLWAEAVMRYELGEPLHLSKEVEVIARGEQEKRYAVDVWEIEVKKIVEKTEGPYLTLELYRVLSNCGNGSPSDFECKRIGKIMRRLNFNRSVRRFNGVLGKCWVKNHMVRA